MSFARRIALAAHAPLLVCVVGLATACGPGAAPAPAAPVASVSAAPSAAPLTVTASFTPAQIAARSTPAVVSIRGPHSLGTGFVVRKDGWIATNLHVVTGSRALKVFTSDKREYDVLDVLAVDEVRDLALLRVDATDLPILALGDSDSVHAGDSVVVIGHPLGLEDTVSNGLVSAVRAIDASLTVLQISAPIAPGSSGGPLFSDKGEVIGVATAIITGGQNLNFGMPVRYVKALLVNTHPVSLAEYADAAPPRHDPSLPAVHRDVPVHDLKLLTGCSDADLVRITRNLGEAIEVGAPAYNQHHFDACFHVYEGAALDTEKKLPAACRGPKKALGDGRARAAKLGDPSAQAWAMRDAFDGLLDVIDRSIAARKKPHP